MEAAAQRKAVDEQKQELLIQKYDADGSGVMEFDEFVEMMVALPPRLAARVLWKLRVLVHGRLEPRPGAKIAGFLQNFANIKY